MAKHGYTHLFLLEAPTILFQLKMKIRKGYGGKIGKQNPPCFLTEIKNFFFFASHLLLLSVLKRLFFLIISASYKKYGCIFVIFSGFSIITAKLFNFGRKNLST